MATKVSPSSPAPALKTIIQELFSQLGFSATSIEVIIKGQEDAITINIQVAPETSGVLIGYHGETINSLQLVISLLAHKSLKEWHRLIININDYRQRREQSLVEMATSAANKVKATGEAVVLPPMDSFDRRLVHLSLTNDPQVVTESVGEGRDRRITIRPQSTPSSDK